MKAFTDPKVFPTQLPNPQVTIGNFDGVHLGHQQILSKVVREARTADGTSVVITFQPHPLRILLPESAPPLIMTSAQKLSAFALHQIDYALILPFDDTLARFSPRQFIECILKDCVAAKKVFVGTNFIFGYQQRGNVETLKALGEEFGFDVEALPQYARRGTRVSSSLIRGLLLEGKVTEANRLLGHSFTLVGNVIAGSARGRTLTVPTLNLVAENELIPKPGVYITQTKWNTESFSSVTNVGVRPTFNESSLSIETHLIGMSEVRRPDTMAVSFLRRLRDERRFSGPEELKVQIEKDVKTAKQFFERLKRFASPIEPSENS